MTVKLLMVFLKVTNINYKKGINIIFSDLRFKVKKRGEGSFSRVKNSNKVL